MELGSRNDNKIALSKAKASLSNFSISFKNNKLLKY